MKGWQLATVGGVGASRLVSAPRDDFCVAIGAQGTGSDDVMQRDCEHVWATRWQLRRRACDVVGRRRGLGYYDVRNDLYFSAAGHRNDSKAEHRDGDVRERELRSESRRCDQGGDPSLWLNIQTLLRGTDVTRYWDAVAGMWRTRCVGERALTSL